MERKNILQLPHTNGYSTVKTKENFDLTCLNPHIYLVVLLLHAIARLKDIIRQIYLEFSFIRLLVFYTFFWEINVKF